MTLHTRLLLALAVLIFGGVCLLIGVRAGELVAVNAEAEMVTTVPRYASIAPDAFVIAPCPVVAAKIGCVIVAAGGKRVLIGAPAGIGAGLAEGDKTPPDAVLLFSLHAPGIEGLDEVRNRAWLGGRRSPLPVSGGAGVGDLVDKLNALYITSDALAYVEGQRRGGFDVEAIKAHMISAGEIAFDTGDLTITALGAAPERFAYQVEYGGQLVIVADCGGQETQLARWPTADAYIGCELDGIDLPERGDWPLSMRIDLK